MKLNARDAARNKAVNDIADVIRKDVGEEVGMEFPDILDSEADRTTIAAAIVLAIEAGEIENITVSWGVNS